jgi:hypothetical protein
MNLPIQSGGNAPTPPAAPVAAGSPSSPSALYEPGDWVTPTVPTTGQLRVIEVEPADARHERSYLVGRYFYESELRLVATKGAVWAKTEGVAR